MLYYATQLSTNLARSDEGYLICRGVPVARTGYQNYLPVELNLPGEDPIPVLRPEEEVFSQACIASFEGKPVTDDHPPDAEGVDAENIRRLQVGHAQNLRRGENEESNLLLADLVITDPETVRRVLEGKREISCGYTYRLFQEKGTYVQREIRGNHIAIVDKGRAGPRVAIRDQEPVTGPTKRRNTSMKNKNGITVMKLISAALKGNDLQPEDLPEILALVQAVEEVEEEVPEAPAAEAPVVVVAAPEATVEAEAEGAEPEVIREEDEEGTGVEIAPLTERLDRIIELLEKMVGIQEEGGDEEEAGHNQEDPDVFVVSEDAAGGRGIYGKLLRPKEAEDDGAAIGDRIMKARNCNYGA